MEPAYCTFLVAVRSFQNTRPSCLAGAHQEDNMFCPESGPASNARR